MFIQRMLNQNFQRLILCEQPEEREVFSLKIGNANQKQAYISHC